MDAPVSGPSGAFAPEPAAPATPGSARRFGAWYRCHVWWATAALVLIVLAAGFVALQVVVRDRVGDGVTVAGHDVGGLSRASAESALAKTLAPAVSTVQLDTGGKAPVTLTLAQLGMTLDVKRTVDAALDVGRRKLPLGLTVWLPGGSRDVAPVVRIDPAALQRGLEPLKAKLDVAARDARLKLSGERVAVVPAADGRQVDGVALARVVTAAIDAGRGYAGPVPTRTVAPAVATADAESRASAAAAYLSLPITLRYRSRSIELSPAEIADMLSVNTGADAQTYPLTFRNDRARARLHQLFAFAESPPVDARIEVKQEGGITVTESREGEVLDMPVLLEDLDDTAVGGGGLRTVFVALKPALPKLTTEEARSMGFSALGSQFTTYYDPRNATRASNISLAAKLVDGTVVAPGSVFSLNAAMGPRTTNRGFDYAPVIASDNVLRQGVGGGICQYATTLFNAVFFAGLPVVERHPHSLYISHYPTGRDATVAWGSLDFRFRNDTGKSLLIRSWTDGDSLTVALVGKTGREVTYKTSSFYDIRKPAHGKADPRVIYDSDLGPGVVRWEKGVDGCSVKVERTVADETSGKVLFRDTFVSKYAPLDWVKRVGT